MNEGVSERDKICNKRSGNWNVAGKILLLLKCAF